MWRQLLEYTDTAGRAMVGVAAVLLVVAVLSFVAGVVQAATGHAAVTLPYWLTTMGGAVVAGVLVYLASRRADIRRR
ncbi:hypothetical protein [Leifsonia poae]|uniref:Uncharacterized protein n=1 Tax=Leifsonia poae TaxID=110933 RepID=A0A9W6H7S5_9MICO|nr:hypothetical protein [Leifsonia poae]GLJ75175.1 hypothetical protein GCM10017584_07490 [Leifsonia poae]